MGIKYSGGGSSGGGGGSGDVTGPASSTDNAIARYDGTGGKTLLDSGITIDDSDNVSGVGTLGCGAISNTGLHTNTQTLGVGGVFSEWYDGPNKRLAIINEFGGIFSCAIQWFVGAVPHGYIAAHGPGGYFRIEAQSSNDLQLRSSAAEVVLQPLTAGQIIRGSGPSTWEDTVTIDHDFASGEETFIIQDNGQNHVRFYNYLGYGGALKLTNTTYNNDHFHIFANTGTAICTMTTGGFTFHIDSGADIELDTGQGHVVDVQSVIQYDNYGVTISGGVADPPGGASTEYSRSYYTLTSQTGTTDDLDSINTSTALKGDILWIEAAASHTITVKNGTGNIQLQGGADVTLTGDEVMCLIFNGTNYANSKI